MRFELLGTSPGLPEPEKNLSALLIETQNYKFLVDCGEGTARSFITGGIGKEEVTAVIITHYHPDHISGFYMLLQTLYLQKRQSKLQVFLPERIEDFKNTLSLFYSFLQKMPFIIEFFLTEEISSHYPDLEVIWNDHLLSYEPFLKENGLLNQMKSFSIKIHEKEKTLVYTSDLLSIQSILDFLQNTDVCIVDALHPELQCFMLLENIIKEKILLTHGDQPTLNEYVKGKNKFEYAIENKIYHL